MNFERGQETKEALGIGMAANSISVFDLGLEIRMEKYVDGSHAGRTNPFRLERRNRIPVKRALYILSKKELSFWDLFRNFRVDSGSAMDCWKWLYSAYRNRKSLEYSEIVITRDDPDSWRRERKTSGISYEVNIYPILYSADPIETHKRDLKEVKAVAFNGKYYPLTPGVKDIKRK